MTDKTRFYITESQRKLAPRKGLGVFKPLFDPDLRLRFSREAQTPSNARANRVPAVRRTTRSTGNLHWTSPAKARTAMASDSLSLIEDVKIGS